MLQHFRGAPVRSQSETKMKKNEEKKTKKEQKKKKKKHTIEQA
jgi:hypothetical protein